MGTPRRLPSSAARSSAIPLGARVTGSLAVSRLLPKLMPTRSLPFGARSARAAETSVMVAHVRSGNARIDRNSEHGETPHDVELPLNFQRRAVDDDRAAFCA